MSVELMSDRLAKTFHQVRKGTETRRPLLSPPIVRGWFGADYFFYLVILELYFHVATAHNILRHLGAPWASGTT
ncbi:DUF1993 family protein [Rhizobium ruizarguesonis]|uniref:DUF1993 family protein n=1 Tax=Rhizobium ruizarguesonis TaxID=2081791 RepID=UPI0018D5A09E|nr:DUF1993 family protein [Rhizobium ruizarguesonis]